jgi:DNA-binding response OmpR family regulator
VVALSATEYRLLEYLVRRAETIVSRAQLADHVWGNDYDPTSNLADVYIGYLRRKLTTAGVAGTLIQTVRGLGYMLKQPPGQESEA